MTNKKKNEKREIDLVSLFLLSGLIVFYALLGILMTFIIITSHAPLYFKIIDGLEWLVVYVLFGHWMVYLHPEIRDITQPDKKQNINDISNPLWFIKRYNTTFH